MRRLSTLLSLSLVVSFIAAHPLPAQVDFVAKTVYTGLAVPWEIEFGPDGMLWVTERTGVVSRIDLETGEKNVILDFRDSTYFHPIELGMLGFTWHPDFPDSPFVYVASSFGESPKDNYRLVLRFTYENDSLVRPVELLRQDPGSDIHQGCRLKIGQDRKLYITTGDNHDEYQAVEEGNIVGKVLRMNLDGSVPDDNPFPGSYTYTRGHRNVQGWTQLPSGTIFTSEHGPFVEDEINMLAPGANYGWPYVEGPCDEEWEAAYCDSVEVTPPVWSSGLGGTVAPCGLEYYNHDRHPSLKNSLLLMTLKNSAVYQFKLNEDQTAVVETNVFIQRSIGRLRDIAIADDGRIFLCTSNRELFTYFPFPQPEDDRIVELIPLEDVGSPRLVLPDTLQVHGFPGEEIRFPMPIGNEGNGNMSVLAVWKSDEGTPIYSDQWRVPVVIPPFSTYDLAGMFSPTEHGAWIGSLRVSVQGQGDHDVWIKADTDVGVIAPNRDTVLITTPVGLPKTRQVTFTNIGVQPVTVDSFEITGADAGLFSVLSSETGVVQPDSTLLVVLRFDPEEGGLFEAAVLPVLSDGYRADTLAVVGISEAVSVQEDNNTVHLRAYPNPFAEVVQIPIPEGIGMADLVIRDQRGAVVLRTSVQEGTLFSWAGTGAGGLSVPTGLYYLTVTSTVFQAGLPILRID